jgi:hypothetical protein
MSVSEITFVGSHLLGESRVGVKKDRLGTAFVGVNLKLIVANGNISVQQPYVTTGFLSGDAVSSRFARLTCQVMDPQALVLSRPTVPTGPTCMAYFEGFAFNAVRERCEFTGMSGCSNPFEFKTLNSCESDFSLR